MSLHRTLAITRRLLSQFRHDRRTLGILFVAPLVILGLFALLFRSETPPAALGVVNRDPGPLGAAIVEQLAQSERVEATETSVDAAAEALEGGSLDGYLVIPDDLSAAVMAGQATALEVHLRGTDPGRSGAISAALSQAVAAAGRALAPPGASPPDIGLEVTYRYGGADLDTLDLFGGPFIGFVVFFLVYVVTSVSFLRERSQGTLERLMASPLRRSEIVLGYMAGFVLIALVQAAEVLVFGIWVLGLYNAGSVLLIFGFEALLALAAVNLGIFLSTFARSEFEAVQFIPLVIVPQALLSGIIVPVANEPDWLQVISNVLPLTYAVDAMRAIMLEGQSLASSDIVRDVLILAGFGLVVLVAASTTLRRTVA